VWQAAARADSLELKESLINGKFMGGIPKGSSVQSHDVARWQCRSSEGRGRVGPEEALHNNLCDMRLVRVDEPDLSGIGDLTQLAPRSCMEPPAHCLGACQFVVTGRAR